jgi:uncharacterized protein (DUF885 family)
VAVVPYVRATHSDGQSWSAAKANLLEAGVNDVSYAPCVRVYHNTTQSITSATETSVAFNSERFDQAGNAADTMHDNVTNNSRLTARYAGVYQITAHIDWNTIPTPSTVLRIRKNGTDYLATLQFVAGTALDARQQIITTMASLAVNDYVEVRVIQTSGGAVTIVASDTGNNQDRCEFMMVRVG